MRKAVIIAVVALVGLAGLIVVNRQGDRSAEARSDGAQGRGGQGGPGGGGGGQFARPPMTVEVAPARREAVSEQITVVGNLIGAATVEVVPKVSGRLEKVTVKLGDRVSNGQVIAVIEDREIYEQVKQAEASFAVARASIKQREADLKFNETALERARSLFDRQLLPKQSLDDADSKYQAAVAQLDLVRAQFAQSEARLDELKITLANTVIRSPVNGFVGKRYLDAGGFASQNAPVVSVVDLSVVRLVANLVEKDLSRVRQGTSGSVEVDAYPGEQFSGRVARVAPVFDAATRTASMEIEVPNDGFRLKAGMYARVRLTVDTRQNALVVPRNALVQVEGKDGVFVASGQKATFSAVQTGLQDEAKVEIVAGLREGTRVVTTGAGALRDGDTIVLAGTGTSGGAGQRGQANRPAQAQGRQ
ncbi:MAG TPA: efflux RND transporter periplasmic adaptor subunit [Vicinamibacterales bacterium]|jgi:RND family efflux transporter MFP subunit|nr:efflux RND transporter periplasmic adaptor subunit [Vicinamibacterales bacterium]